MSDGRPETARRTIALLIRSLNYGGAERQVVELAKGLLRRGREVVVVVFYDEGKLGHELRAAGVQLVVLGKRGRWDVLPFVTRLLRALRRVRPSVIYAFMIEPSLLAVLLKPALPRTRVVWGVRVSNLDFDRYDWFPRATFRVSRTLARFADLIISNSWAGAAHHQRLGYPKQRMVVVPNGIDVGRFRPDRAAGQRQRVSWGVPPNAPLIGLVGRLDPMKDHSTFLKAARSVRQRVPDSWFVCVGDGPEAYRAALEQQAVTLGIGDRVLWAGGQPDMVAVYNALSVCCLSSAYGEGFSNVLAEAMACDLPCVATDVGDAARILEGCAPVVTPGDFEGLAVGIQRAMSSRESSGMWRRRVEEHFSVDRMVLETERVLEECVGAA